MRESNKVDGGEMEIRLRKARDEDKEKVIVVESKSTPNLSYVPNVWEEFTSDQIGEFSVAEMDGEIVGCGKYTLVPDGSAWLETLRVIPERQDERFFERARQQNVKTMRMYTGLNNVVSKGLAERYGFKLVATYRGAGLPCISIETEHSNEFKQVRDPERVTALLMSFKEKWAGFLVMNRTFYSLTPALCTHLAENGMVYEDTSSRSVITLGARFMPERALHIGVFGGDVNACLSFAKQLCAERKAGRLNCDFPPSAVDVQDTFVEHGFQLTPSDFIVMEVHIDE